jgi:PAS domain S-box-containing protein
MADGMRVLCVDDEDALLELVRQDLEQSGDFSVDAVMSAPEGLDLLKSNHYDAIVSDYQLPGMDGIEFLKKIRTTDKTIPFILITGRSREEIVIEALNNGADFYLQKTGDPTTFLTELMHVIRKTVLMRRTQVTLAEQEERLHDLQNASDLIQSVSPDGHFLFVNKKWLDTLGYQEHDLPTLTIFDIIHKDSLQHCMDTFKRVIAGENVGIIDAVFKTRDGTRVYVEGMANCKLLEGACQYTRGIFKDVTQKKEMEKGLYESETKFATVFKSNPVALTLVAAADGVFVDANDAFLRSTGFGRSEVIGKTSLEIGIFADKNEYIRFIGEIREKHSVQGMEIHCRIKTGEIRICRFSSSIVITGHEPHILSTVEDITEQKAAESALHALVTGMVGTTGRESLDRITESISTWLGADCIMIGEIMPDQEHVLVISMLLDGKKIPGYTYTLKGTPCENTAEKGFCVYSDNVATLFPGSRDLDELNIRGYAGTPLRNSEGQVIGILCILTRNPLNLPPSSREILDIIAAKASVEIGRMKAEKALSESEEKFRTLVEYSLDGILILDPAGKILFVNPAAGRIIETENYPEMIGTKNVMEFIAPESQEAAHRDFGEVAKGIDGYLAQYKIITVDQSSRWVESIGKSLSFKGEPAILISLRDITDRQRAEAAIRESGEKFRALVETSPDMIWETDLQGRFRYVSPLSEKLMGYLPEELIGKPVTDMVTEEVRPFVLQEMGRIISSKGAIPPMEFPSRHRDGHEMTIEIRVARLTAVDGTPIGFHGIGVDITERRRTEDALRESEKLFREVFSNANDAITLVENVSNGPGRFLLVNDKTIQLLGYSRDELLQKSPRDIVPKAIMDNVQPDAMKKLFRDGGAIFESAYVRKDGSTVPIETSIHRFGYQGKDVALAITRDISERKRTEDALYESEKKFRAIFENSPYPIAINSLPDNKFLEVNAAFLNVSGFTEEELLGKDPIEAGLISLVDATRLIARRLLDGKIENVPLALTVKEGRRVHVLFSTMVVMINDRPALVTVTVETTNLKRVEEELIQKNAELTSVEEELRANFEELRRNEQNLSASESRYRTLFENMLDGFAYCTVLYDQTGIIEDFIFLQTNKAFSQLMGQDRLTGKRVSAAIPWIKEMHPEFFEICARVVRTRIPEIFEIYFKPLGKWLDVSVFCPEKDCFVAVFEDFTERRSAEEALRLANKKLNLLSGITRHDINNQLLTLNGFVALLNKKISDPAQQKYLSRMTNATSQILAMIRFTKEYEQVGVQAPAWQNLHALVNNTVKISTLGWVTVVNDFPEDAEVLADPLIAKVFFNLIDNALRHGGKITTLRFALEARDEDCILICEDNGDGIARDEKEKIFERGFGKNTGFGLSISRDILAITGITIKETGEPGIGARFEITVPKGQYRSKPPSPSPNVMVT